jgi:hypothetical protein
MYFGPTGMRFRPIAGLLPKIPIASRIYMRSRDSSKFKWSTCALGFSCTAPVNDYIMFMADLKIKQSAVDVRMFDSEAKGASLVSAAELDRRPLVSEFLRMHIANLPRV